MPRMVLAHTILSYFDFFFHFWDKNENGTGRQTKEKEQCKRRSRFLITTNYFPGWPLLWSQKLAHSSYLSAVAATSLTELIPSLEKRIL